MWFPLYFCWILPLPVVFSCHQGPRPSIDSTVVRGAISMAPGKFQGDTASLGQIFPEAVALGLCHSSASQSHPTLLTLQRGWKTEPEEMDMPTRFRGYSHPRHGEDVCIFTHKSSFKLGYKGGEGGEARRKFWGTLKPSF